MAATSKNGWAVPRQPGALPSGPVPAACGCSAFAFQGTNAHAVLTGAGLGGRGSGKPAAIWAKQRFWVAPPAHAALLQAAVKEGGRQAVLHASLVSPSLVYFWDHIVSGKVLLPGAGLFELAASAASQLAGASSGAVLAAVSIPAPLLLPSLSATPVQAPLLALCTMDASTGAIEISSLQRTVHLRASLAAIAVGHGSSRSPQRLSCGPLVGLGALKLPAADTGSVAEIGDSAVVSCGVSLSPSVLDSCLHLGALPAAAAQQLKVPAGIQALLFWGASPCTHSCAASARQVTSSVQASLIDYSLLAASQTACLVSGLLAKPLSAQPTAAPATRPPAPAAATDAGSGMLYNVQWIAASPVRNNEPVAGSMFVPSTEQARCGAALLCSAGIAAFQTGAEAQLGNMHLQTSATQPQLATTPVAGMGSDMQSSNATAGLLWGMLRSVMLEQTAVAVSAMDIDALAAAAGVSASRRPVLQLGSVARPGASPSDAYGAAVRGRLHFVAALAVVVASPCSDDQLAPIKAAKGMVAVTGGMGSLGSVLASWVECGELATSLCLIGRSGRMAASSTSAGLAGLLSASVTAVTLLLSDVSSREGSGSMLASATSPAVPLTALFHSGGVLADATLAKQSVWGIRAVFSAKVSAVERWGTTLSRQPAAAQVLFSSVAALLGSGGQPNYCAANALLDATASWHRVEVGMTRGCKSRPCVCAQLPALVCRRACQCPAFSGAHGQAAAWRPRPVPQRCGCSAWAWP